MQIDLKPVNIWEAYQIDLKSRMMLTWKKKCTKIWIKKKSARILNDISTHKIWLSKAQLTCINERQTHINSYFFHCTKIFLKLINIETSYDYYIVVHLKIQFPLKNQSTKNVYTKVYNCISLQKYKLEANSLTLDQVLMKER